ncbi:hypothetical protein D3981_005488 [Escherichia coli]|nr:hypothetical protein [Escherichia coli]
MKMVGLLATLLVVACPVLYFLQDSDVISTQMAVAIFCSITGALVSLCWDARRKKLGQKI